MGYILPLSGMPYCTHSRGHWVHAFPSYRARVDHLMNDALDCHSFDLYRPLQGKHNLAEVMVESPKKICHSSVYSIGI